MQEFARDVPRGNVQMEISDIPFSEMPHQTRLFLDYIADPLSLRRFYPNVVTSPADVAEFSAEVLRNYLTDRDQLCNALESINRKAGAGEGTFENIEKLKSPDCVAVLTGQQAGLFSGPLYTIYKALSAIRLAQDLNEAGIKAVPVFWTATEDHDLAEISTTFVPQAVKYESSDGNSGLPIGSVRVEAGSEALIDQLFQQLIRTEYTDDLRRKIADSYSVGERLGSAFMKLLAHIFSDRGLIFIDPMDPAIRNLSAPIVSKAIEHSQQIGEALLERTRELESAGYAAQVLIEEDHFPLFWIDDDGKRDALRRDGDKFRVKGSRTVFSPEDLKQIASENPERLSPAVMLRPVVQDHLLPTIAYFGGAAEVAYFAQNSVVYQAIGRPVTPIFHRQSYTIVEPKLRRNLDQFGIGLCDLFAAREDVFLKIAANVDGEDTLRLFADAEAEISAELDRLDERLTSIDITVAANLATRRRKILYHLGALKKKALLATIRKDETAHRQVNDLFDILMPGGALQERSLNVLYFLNKFGPRFMDWLYLATDVNNTAHRVVDL